MTTKKRPVHFKHLQHKQLVGSQKTYMRIIINLSYTRPENLGTSVF